MYTVKYYNKQTSEVTYRRYKYMDEYQLRKVIDNYSRRHKVVAVTVVKEY